MDVDPAWRHKLALRVDDTRRALHLQVLSDANDHVTLDGNVTCEGRGTGAIDDGSSTDEDRTKDHLLRVRGSTGSAGVRAHGDYLSTKAKIRTNLIY